MKLKCLALGILLLISCKGALAWNCPSGQIRIQAPPGTPTTAPYYDVVEGIAFICTPNTPPSTPPTQPTSLTQNQNQQQNQNANSNSTSTSGSSSNSSSNSNAKATGGNSTANGGNSTANGGNSVSTSGVSNSGNSSNSNVSTSQGGAGGQGGQGGSATAANNSSGNQTSISSSTNIAAPRIPVSTAVAPTQFTNLTCFKPVGGAAQTMAVGASLGMGTVDGGCDARAFAAEYASWGSVVAACKMMVAQKRSRKAGVTLEDCLDIYKQTVPVSVPVVAAPPPVTPTIIVVPAPAPVVPVAIPAPVLVPAATVNGTLRIVGTCRLSPTNRPTNACNRMIDDAAIVLGNDPGARLIIIAPRHATGSLTYAATRVARSRIELHLSDEQNDSITVQTWGAK
jgi:hypothetical protein